MTPPLPEHDVLVFEHIPKTAGSTFRRLLLRRFGKDLFIEGGRFNPHPQLDQLKERIREGRPPRAISAHFGYGFHELLPGDLRYTHFTFLREPISRTISHYYFALDQRGIDQGTSLRAFCESDAPPPYPLRSWNFQATFLSGLRVRATLADVPRPPRPEDHDEALLEAAVRNLDTFPAFGLVDRFEESLILFGRTYGWPLRALCFVSLNRGRRRPNRVELTGDEREVLHRVNRIDFELYRYAEARFERLLAERVPDLPDQLQALRRLNRLYRPTLLAADRIERAVGRAQRVWHRR